ncbi:hypothetical protein HHI36_004356 [Cryptolaemus montrouzieri]|uniref:Reverse transcriptase n=1 Tax=Cryptolaemus montrouzieri TaxID=559131 RepID=A0ABD2NRA5_9CUCU
MMMKFEQNRPKFLDNMAHTNMEKIQKTACTLHHQLKYFCLVQKHPPAISILVLADDAKIYINLLTNSNQLQEDSIRINRWCWGWLLPLNPDKCKVLYIGKNNPRVQYHLAGFPIGIMDKLFDLGVYCHLGPDLVSSYLKNLLQSCKTYTFLYNTLYILLIHSGDPLTTCSLLYQKWLDQYSFPH